MNFINDILMPQIKLVQGKEGDLLRRYRKGKLSVIAGIAGAVYEMVVLAKDKDSVKAIGQFFENLIYIRLDKLITPDVIPELIGLLVIVVGLGTYFTFRWTSFLLKESE